MPHNRTCYEIYGIRSAGNLVGYLVFGWTQATRCRDWYGSVDQVSRGDCQVSKYQVINLSRVWIDPDWQRGGMFYTPEHLPGFIDRRGQFRSTLASDAIRLWIEDFSQHYILIRPPVFLDQPYELRWLMSYCNTHLHKGTIYQKAGFELYLTNEDGIQTWRTPLVRLTPSADYQIRLASQVNSRSIRIRSKRQQTPLFQMDQ
jgi:hypothetical protein